MQIYIWFQPTLYKRFFKTRIQRYYMHERPPTDSMKEFQSKVLQVDTLLRNDTKARNLLWGHIIFVEYNALMLSRY